MVNDQSWCTRLGVGWFLCGSKMIDCNVVVRKGCIDWLDRCCFTTLAIIFGCHWVNRYVCIGVHTRIFWCSNQGDSTIHVGGGLTYLLLWGNITNYLHETKIMEQLASLIISSPPSLKNIAQISRHSFWPNQLIFAVFRISTLSILKNYSQRNCNWHGSQSTVLIHQLCYNNE